MSRNPAAVIREVSSAPEHERYIHQLVGRITGGGTHAVTIETGLTSILSAIVIKENATVAVLATTVADSTAVVGTKKVSFTVADGGTYSYIITGYVSGTVTVPTTAGATTITYKPILGT